MMTRNAMIDAGNEVIQDDLRGEYIPDKNMVTYNVHNDKVHSKQ